MPTAKKMFQGTLLQCADMLFVIRLSMQGHYAHKSSGDLANIIQILTASSVMVKTMTPEVIPGVFYFPYTNQFLCIYLMGYQKQCQIAEKHLPLGFLL